MMIRNYILFLKDNIILNAMSPFYFSDIAQIIEIEGSVARGQLSKACSHDTGVVRLSNFYLSMIFS